MKLKKENKLAKQEDGIIKVKGRVTDASPGAKFKVTLADNGHVVNTTISGKIRKNNIQILLDDLVDVECSVYDLNNGRITYRYS